MSFLLAIESSSKPLSVALFKDGQLLDEIVCPPDDRTHSEKLLPLIHQLFSKHKISLSNIEAFALTNGPGAYTSLRVSQATIMGLVLDRDVPIYTISTLKALAFASGRQNIFLAPVLKAGRGRIYAAVYEWKKGTLHEVVCESIFEPHEFIHQINHISPLPFLIGSGIELINASFDVFDRIDLHPQASHVGSLVYAEKMNPIRVKELTIRYLQEPDIGKPKGLSSYDMRRTP